MRHFKLTRVTYSGRLRLDLVVLNTLQKLIFSTNEFKHCYRIMYFVAYIFSFTKITKV